MKYPEMNGKVAIVTGGGDGCGKGIVKALVEQGAIVVACGVNYSSCVQTSNELAVGPDKDIVRVIPMYCDVSKRDDVQHVIEETLKRFKKIDYLINNAGISEVDFIPRIKEHHWDRIMDVNAKGTFLMTQAVANTCIVNKQSCTMVNVVSESAFTWHTMCASYTASKAAQMAFGKVAARELIKYGIRVNNVHPSIVEGTNLTKYLNEEFKKEYGWDEATARKMYLTKIPVGRFCKIEDVAKAVLWLLSSESSFVVGTDLMVSGGQGI